MVEELQKMHDTRGGNRMMTRRRSDERCVHEMLVLASLNEMR